MAEVSVDDLLALDRDVARGWSSLVRWRAALALDVQAHADEDPLETVRRAAGKSTWDALAALTPSAADAPLREALRRWVYTLMQARIGRDDEIAWARAAADARGLYAGATPRRVDWREAWRGLASARTAADARLWLEAAADVGPELAAVARARSQRRLEVARRLGLEHPWIPLVDAPAESLRRFARYLLDATEDLSRAVWREELGADGSDAPAVLHAAMGRRAPHGWPPRITGRWIEETVSPGGRGARIDLPRLPAALGAASFARALHAFGFAVRAPAASGGSSSAPGPFALMREPGFAAAHRLGFVFAALPADADWQVRALGVGRRTALAQARVLGCTALLEVRMQAARLLLGDDAAPAARDVFDETGPRLFGAALDARLRGAWPAARDDEPARFVGLLLARPLAASLRDRFDADWYRNPRAWAELRATAAAPAREPLEIPALEAGAHALVRALEEALG